jgi:hypothetical protein
VSRLWYLSRLHAAFRDFVRRLQCICILPLQRVAWIELQVAILGRSRHPGLDRRETWRNSPRVPRYTVISVRSRSEVSLRLPIGEKPLEGRQRCLTDQWICIPSSSTGLYKSLTSDHHPFTPVGPCNLFHASSSMTWHLTY